MNAARSPSSRQATKASSSWSTASTSRPSGAAAEVASCSARSGCSPGRSSAIAQRLAAGQDALAQGREQPGAQHRRLAAARRTDEAEHRRARQAGHHLRHEPLAPEEERGVLGLERGKALERADHDVRRDLRSLARGLQRDDDVARELVLGRAQPGATRRRAPGGAAQAADALGPRPLDRGLVDLARHAAAVLHQAGDRHLHVLARVRVEARDGGHVVGAERSERDRPIDARRHGRVVGLRRGEDEDRQRVEALDQLAQGRADLLAGAVDVVDDEQRRAPRACRAGDRGARGCRIAGAGGVQHDGAVAVHLARQLRGQPRLPHSAGAEDEDEAPASGVRVAPRLAQHVELGLTARPAACPRRARPAAARTRAPAGRAAGSWRRIASCSSRSAGPGSTPICSTSADRACR